MADDPEDDTWLYGSNPEAPEDDDHKDVSTVQNDNPIEAKDKSVVKETEKTVSSSACINIMLTE